MTDEIVYELDVEPPEVPKEFKTFFVVQAEYRGTSARGPNAADTEWRDHTSPKSRGFGNVEQFTTAEQACAFAVKHYTPLIKEGKLGGPLKARVVKRTVEVPVSDE